MVNFLSTFKPRVYHDAKTTVWIWIATLLQCQFGRQSHHAPKHACIVCGDLCHRRDMPLGNHQEVDGSPRLDVMKSKNLFVFIDPLRGNLASDDFAEKAVRIVHCGVNEIQVRTQLKTASDAQALSAILILGRIPTSLWCAWIHACPAPRPNSNSLRTKEISARTLLSAPNGASTEPPSMRCMRTLL